MSKYQNKDKKKILLVNSMKETSQMEDTWKIKEEIGGQNTTKTKKKVMKYLLLEFNI